MCVDSFLKRAGTGSKSAAWKAVLSDYCRTIVLRAQFPFGAILFSAVSFLRRRNVISHDSHPANEQHF